MISAGRKRFARILASAAPVLCCLAAACSQTAGRESFTADQLLAHFDAIAFGDQHESGRDLQRVRKWNRPIRIALHGAEAPPFRDTVRRYAAELSDLTGLGIHVLDRPDDRANFEIRFVAWDDMEREARAFAPRPDWLPVIVEGSACLFVFLRNPDDEITRALVLVSTRESAEHKTSCLLEEMTQALGLPNDSDRVRPSIFNAFDKLSHLTAADRIVVRTLYDPRLAPALPRPEALVRARRIIAEQIGRL